MPKVSVQFCNFSSSVAAIADDRLNFYPAQMLPAKLGDRLELDVTSVATSGSNRPVKEAAEGFTHAICIPLDGQVLVAVGADPTADQSSRLLALSGLEYVVHVPDDHMLSFVMRS